MLAGLRDLRVVTWVWLVLPVVLAGSPGLLAAQTNADQGLDPAVAERLQAGQALLKAGGYKEAIKELKKADKKAGGRCVACLAGLARAYNGAGDSKSALQTVEAILRQTDDEKLVGFAYNERGLALLGSAGSDGETLRQAETAFRRAVELTGAEIPRFNLGVTLLRLERDDEGVAVLESLLEDHPTFFDAVRTRDLIENPVRARKNLAPEVEAVTLSGERISTADLQGKVVLLDFWGTWCAPCREAVPGLRSLSRRMDGEPFVLISVSNDSEEEALLEFIAKNGMTWPQVWDRKTEILHDFGVRSFPSYFLLDHEGEIVYRGSGWSTDIEREILRQVARAVKLANKSTEDGS